MMFGFVDEHRHIWPVRVMCTVLGLSVSGYYARRSRAESPRAAPIAPNRLGPNFVANDPIRFGSPT